MKQTRENRTTRRQALLTGLAGVASIAAPWSEKTVYAQTGTTPKLIILRPSAKSLLWGPEDYAHELGLFAKHGVAVESVPTNKGVNTSGVVSGDVDAAMSDPIDSINVRLQGPAVKIFAFLHERYAIHILLKNEFMDKAGVTEASPLEEKVRAMKGLRMGHSGVGSGPEMYIRYCATIGGLDPNKDIELVSLGGGGAGMVAGIQQGQIDGYCGGAPFSNVAIEKFGCAYLVQSQTNPPPLFEKIQATALMTSERTLADKREALVSYTAAIAESMRHIHTDPSHFKAWFATFMDTIDPPIFEAALRDNFTMYATQPSPRPDSFQIFVDYLDVVNKTRGLPPTPATLTFDLLNDPSIARDAFARI